MEKSEKIRLLGPLIAPLEKQTAKGPLVLRDVIVSEDHMSTVVMPGDTKVFPPRWLDAGNGTVTQGNSARYLIRGVAAYDAMADAMATATSADHFIFLAGWSVTLDFPLADPPNETLTMGKLLAKRSAAGVKIRGLYWRQADELASAVTKFGSTRAAIIALTPGGPLIGAGLLAQLALFDRTSVTSRSILGLEGQNFNEVKFINSLPTGIGILDKHGALLGSHHQKILLVNGSKGLIAFVGGIDVFPDRVWPNGTNGSTSLGSPYEDVHCQIKGPGAQEVLKVFVERWNKCGVPEATKDSTAWMETAPNATVAGATSAVQIGHTHGNPACAPPKKTAKAMILKAIKSASRYIYVEDQYLVNLEAAAALNAMVPKLEHITILIPHWKISDLLQCTYRRRKFINQLYAGLSDADKKKVGIYCLKPAGGRFTYVHSKFWIIDDQVAIIGSANCNRRGWDSDSEIVGGVSEVVDSTRTEIGFAHALRMDLWAHFLGVKRWQLHDPVASVAYWRQPPALATIEPYDSVSNDSYDLDKLSQTGVSGVVHGMLQSTYDAAWELIDPP